MNQFTYTFDDLSKFEIVELHLIFLFFCCCFSITEPSSIQAMPDEKITEGENLTLTRQAFGTSPLTVSWIKVSSGQPANGHVLELTNINKSEAGDYRCETSNECGNATELVNIDVQCEYLIIIFNYQVVHNAVHVHVASVLQVEHIVK